MSLSAGKPQKLLVVINPIGGKGTARQVFEKRVQPIFALAGVELVVKCRWIIEPCCNTLCC